MTRALPTYRGRFGPAQAERLLWRAGFGPRKGEAEALAELGLSAAVDSLLAPPAYAATGPEPTDAKGRPLAPRDAAGHDHVWWLDRMVRGNQPLVERMTLVWHDWFATSNQGVGSQSLMLDQNELFRASWAGSFRDLSLVESNVAGGCAERRRGVEVAPRAERNHFGRQSGCRHSGVRSSRQASRRSPLRDPWSRSRARGSDILHHRDRHA